MDQIKIGKFIAACRKQEKLTQMQLAEKLGITDRAVSKWETGRTLPDASLMLELCGILNITVNDLLSGEVVQMENYNKEMENRLLEMVKEKELADKRLLKLEVLIAVLSLVVIFVPVIIAALLSFEAQWMKDLVAMSGLIPGAAGLLLAVKLEQVAGYYACPHCGYKYVPSYRAVNLAPHLGRTRKMKCPACGKRTWQKKVLTKE